MKNNQNKPKQPEWKVKENCPFKELIEMFNGKLKRDFSCEECLVNPDFCNFYRQLRRKKI